MWLASRAIAHKRPLSGLVVMKISAVRRAWAAASSDRKADGHLVGVAELRDGRAGGAVGPSPPER
jgi:hypothetical protein